MDNPEKTEGAIKNGQYRENRRDNQEWTIQRNMQHRTQDRERRRKNEKKTQHRKDDQHGPH